LVDFDEVVVTSFADLAKYLPQTSRLKLLSDCPEPVEDYRRPVCRLDRLTQPKFCIRVVVNKLGTVAKATTRDSQLIRAFLGMDMSAIQSYWTSPFISICSGFPFATVR
jgi:hypothetical protein